MNVMYFLKLPQFSHNAVWGGVAHRQADGREYHPLRWSAGMRVCGHVGEQAYSKIAYEQARVWKEILRLPCRAALEDGRAGRISMSLDFFGTFLVKQKSAEKCHEHYPELKIINMNGRLYDPVIGRFFSPDKYVANSSFSQDFNRYSYARNNPLKYSDPSGENLWDVISTVLFFPARVLSETFQWINDKINGDSHPGGYFNYGYMTNQTAPGSTPPYNPLYAIPFGQPGYMPPGANWGDMENSGSGYGMTASNDMRDDIDGYEYYWNEITGWTQYPIDEIGGGSGKESIFLDETIPPGACPTATGALAVSPGNPNYPIFGPNTRNGGRSSHYGVDYGGEEGDPVYAMYDGKVEFNINSNDFGPYFVRTKSFINGKTYYVDYGHLSYSSLKKGTWLNAGDLVGLMGREGSAFNSTTFIPPTHVHIAVWRYVNGMKGYVQPSWQPRFHTIPWLYRLYY